MSRLSRQRVEVLLLALHGQVARAHGLALEHLAEFASDELMRRVRDACATCAQRAARPTSTENDRTREDMPMDLETINTYRTSVMTRLGEVAYVDVGEGPVVLFVHGIATNAALWRNAIGMLRDECRCIAVDLPLHGRTPARAGQDLSLNGLADVVGAFCDALDLVDVSIVAHDTGGAVAQILVARDPDRVRTFTLTNCETHDNVPPEAFRPTVELARTGALALSAPALLADLAMARNAVFATGYEHEDALGLDVVGSFLEPVLGTAERAGHFERLLASLDAGDLLAVEPALRELTVPTLVVWGTADEFFEMHWAYWLRDTIPGVTEVVPIAGGRLFFVDERAAELVGHLRRQWTKTNVLERNSKC